MKLGIAGGLTRAFIASPLVPLMLLGAALLGLIALGALPREEEPQISVPMVDIHLSVPGLRAEDAVKLVTEPLETIVKAVNGVEHVYSQTVDDAAMVTARFHVGESADAAILRVHEKVRANIDRLPLGVPEPVIVGRGIDDVAIVVVTLAPRPEAADRWSAAALTRIARELHVELARIEDVGLSYLVGAQHEEIRIRPDPERLALHGVTLQGLAEKIAGANHVFRAGLVRDGGSQVGLAVGRTLREPAEIGGLLLTTRDGRAVYVRDVADIEIASRPEERLVSHYAPDGAGGLSRAPAVSIALAKRAGANAVEIAERIHEGLARAEGRIIPADVVAHVTRDYGETAKEKADELLFHLGLATVSIVILVAFAIGLRAAAVVAVVIPVTILLTLAASWLMGYTLNRVSLFALIFSIGILVDDAIVVIENIARHWAMRDGRSAAQAAVDAVAEVGNPTIIATLTVVAALLPMLAVSGMMGPYMSPIPANASAAMILSFFVAVIVTPWLMVKVGVAKGGDHAEREGLLGRGYRAVAGPILASRARSWAFLLAVGVATLGSMALFATRDVTVKLLPFDDKPELSVVLDLPEGASVEATDRALGAVAARLAGFPDIVSMQAHAGTAAPFDFNGLVRHYYLRESPEMGQLQINLTDRHDRDATSHDLALAFRDALRGLDLPEGTALKVVEPPPGPPVLATLLAEIYGPDPETRRETARKVREAFEAQDFVVDVDDTIGAPPQRLRIAAREDDLEFHQVAHGDVYGAVEALYLGRLVGYSHRGEGRQPLPIRLALPPGGRRVDQAALSTPVPANLLPGARGVVELGDVAEVSRETASHMIFRRNGLPLEMVTAELAGAYEAPLYGMLAVAETMDAIDWGAAGRPEILLHGQPLDISRPALLWDGEWEVTYVTFRDMGAAFGVALAGIFVLVVIQFGSFRLPLAVLTPIPLTFIGILLGHWAMGAPFSATSMIGFIALAGIIVRNSILLVDFIRHAPDPSMSLRAALLEAGAIRFKPILLTALAAMLGAAVILFDPIFQGLAISLLFGLASSTLLTVLVIPAIYVVLRDADAPVSGAQG